MNIIVDELLKLSKFQEFLGELEKKNSPISISGLSDVGKIQFISGIYTANKKPLCIITYNEIQAKNIINNLNYFIDNIDFFPKREIAAYDFIVESKDLPYERIDILNKIKQKKSKIIVTTIEALMQNMITPKALYQNVINIKVGDTLNLNTIKEKLVSLGYERADLVEGRGQFSIRGGIIDVSLDEKKGIRIELWGDDVDSIREFNISSQRSETMLDSVTIYPAHELIIEDSLEKICNRILNNNEAINTSIKYKEQDEYENKIKNIKTQDVELIQSGDYLNKIDKYFNDFYTKQSGFIDYLGKDFTIILDEFSKINQRRENIIIENNNLIKSLIEKQRYIPQSIINLNDFNYEFEEKQVVYLEKQDIGLSKSSSIKYVFNYRDVNYYKSEIESLFEDIRNNIKKKKIVILAGNEEETNKFGALLTEKEIPNVRLGTFLIRAF